MNSSLTLILVAGVVLFLGAGFLFFSGTGPRKPKKVIPANQKRYHDDETLEGPVLTKVLGWSLIFTFMCAAALRSTGSPNLSARSVSPRSTTTMPLSAARSCMPMPRKTQKDSDAPPATVASKAVPPDTCCSQARKKAEVTWTAPPLEDVFYRFSREQVHDILVYGRPNTPMPAWGLRGGGPMTEQMLNDVISYLESVQTDPETAKQNAGGGKAYRAKSFLRRTAPAATRRAGATGIRT